MRCAIPLCVMYLPGLTSAFCQNLAQWSLKQKEMKRDRLEDTAIWDEEPEEKGRVLYFQNMA